MRIPRLCAAIVAVTFLLSGCSSPSEGPVLTAPPTTADTETGGAPEDHAGDIEQPDSFETEYSAARQFMDLSDFDKATDVLDGIETAEADELREEIERRAVELVEWTTPDQVPHLFFHSLIVDPTRAFDGEPTAQGYLDYMVTLDEFTAILESLYQEGYILVAPYDFAALNVDGEMEYLEMMLPPGKKPLVISVDDLSYYEYMEGDGFASRLVVTSDGEVMNEYVDPNGQTVVGAYDVPPTIDEFVAEHPDFSYRGAKGILALTGYNGVFGYRTSARQYTDSKTLDQDIAQAKSVAGKLKEHGWLFASHSWGHIDMGGRPIDAVKWDMKLWNDEVRPILGDTDLFIYPFGADISGVSNYQGGRYELMREDGFHYFFGVDGTTHAWMQQGRDYQRQARINVDGLQFQKELRGDRPVLKEFFDVEDVMDPARVENSG